MTYEEESRKSLDNFFEAKLDKIADYNNLLRKIRLSTHKKTDYTIEQAMSLRKSLLELIDIQLSFTPKMLVFVREKTQEYIEFFNDVIANPLTLTQARLDYLKRSKKEEAKTKTVFTPVFE